MISSLYVEPGVSFNISYKVFQFIEKVLNSQVMMPYGFDQKDKEVWLSLIISTKRECRRVEAKGPDWDRRNKCVTWGLWLPYNEIVESPNQIDVFVSKVFEAAGMVLSNYGVKKEDIEQAKEKVKKEVVGNKDYIKTDQRIPLLDLSKIKF